jgi:helicase SWR1
MDIDPPTPSVVVTPAQDDAQPAVDAVQEASTPSTSTSKPAKKFVRPSLPARALRARPSLPASTSSTSNGESSKLRPPTEKELAAVTAGLAPEALSARREETTKNKEKQVKDVVDDHDAAVREKFHLERFVSLLENFAPDVCVSLEHVNWRMC